MELGLHRERYEELVEELRREGHDAELIEAEERRSRDAWQYADEVFDETLQVLGEIGVGGAIALADVARRILRARRERTRRRRRGVIHLPDGETHEFEISSRDD
jgi:hypothetical protein